jgi:hypothetical protein
MCGVNPTSRWQCDAMVREIDEDIDIFPVTKVVSFELFAALRIRIFFVTSHHVI